MQLLPAKRKLSVRIGGIEESQLRMAEDTIHPERGNLISESFGARAEDLSIYWRINDKNLQILTMDQRRFRDYGSWRSGKIAMDRGGEEKKKKEKIGSVTPPPSSIPTSREIRT